MFVDSEIFSCLVKGTFLRETPCHFLTLLSENSPFSCFLRQDITSFGGGAETTMMVSVAAAGRAAKFRITTDLSVDHRRLNGWTGHKKLQDQTEQWIPFSIRTHILQKAEHSRRTNGKCGRNASKGTSRLFWLNILPTFGQRFGASIFNRI